MENDKLTSAPSRWVRNESLTSHHDISGFDCGIDSLNVFLHRHALTGPAHGLSQTWTVVDADKGKVLAYFTLGLATVSRSSATERVAKGIPNYDIPCLLLARLAVDRSVQGQGLGGLALEAAMRKAVNLGRKPKMADGTPGLPMRAMIVNAMNDKAASFYQHYGFEVSPTDPLHLLMLLKDIEPSFREL